MNKIPVFHVNSQLETWLSPAQIEELRVQCLRVLRDFWPAGGPIEDARYAHLNGEQRLALEERAQSAGDCEELLSSFELPLVSDRKSLIQFKRQLGLVRDKTSEQIKLIQLVVKLIHETDIVPELSIIHQDERLLVLAKQAGLLVHPFKKHTHDRYTLMSLARNKVGKYVYPVHRLDRAVSGVVVMALESEYVKPIQEMWHHEETVKEYIALVRGDLDDEGVMDFALSDENGVKKECETKYWALERFTDLVLVKVQISTGRKHQIRRHFSRRVTPVVGDTVHGKGDVNYFFREHFNFERIFLHHLELTLKNPFGEGLLKFRSELPSELNSILEKLRSEEVVFKRERKSASAEEAEA